MSVTGLLAALGLPAAAQTASQPIDFDLRQWTKQGPESVGEWQVADDGSEVIQRRNDDPTYFVSPERLTSATITGTFEVQTTGDDDFIGFVIGYNGPTQDQPFAYDHLLFDWKQSKQSWGGCEAQEGFTLTRVSGTYSQDPDERREGNGAVIPINWCHEQQQDDPRAEVLATKWGDGLGWEDNTEYQFRLDYSPDQVTIAIDGEQVLQVDGSFPTGSFGFYNYSQADVRYSGFSAAEKPTQPPPDTHDDLPTRLQDLWVVDGLRTVDDNGNVVDLTSTVLDELEAQGGTPVTLIDGVTFTPKPALDPHVARPDRTSRGDVQTVGGLLETADDRALAFLGTPDRGTGIAIDDRLLFELTFLDPSLLAPGDPLLVDHTFTQVLPSGGDDDLAPLDLLAQRMAAHSGRYLAVRGTDNTLDPALLSGQAWQTYVGSTGIDGPAKAKPMLDGLQSGAKDALEEGGGTGGVKKLLKNIFDGSNDSRCLVFSQVTINGGGSDCGGDPPPLFPPGPGGSATGDPHLRTFDGLYYDLQAAGEFVAAKTGDTELQLRFEPYRDSRVIAVVTAAALAAAGHRVTVTAGDPATVRLDGRPLPPTQLGAGVAADGLQVKQWADELYVTTPAGHQLRVDPRGELLDVHLGEGPDVAWTGLFGDGDGNRDDDLTTRDGRNVGPDPTYDERYGQFAESWRISQSTSLFDYASGASTDTYTDRSFPDRETSVDSLPAADRTRAEAVCRQAGIIDAGTFEDCVLDYALTGDMSFVASAQGVDRIERYRAGALDVGRPGCPTGAVPEDGFSDVPADSVHEATIDCLAWWGVTHGRADGTYAPHAALDRDQMASLLAAMLDAAGVDLPQDAPDAFTDDDGNVHEGNINRLAAAGVVAGTGDGRYLPDRPVNRAQMASLLVGALHAAGIDLTVDGDHFTDDDGSVHEASINGAAAAGLIEGRTRDTYAPGLTVSRAQTATLVTGAIALLVEKGVATRPA